MSTHFFLPFLTALMLHVVGLAVLSAGWHAWREPWPRPEPLSPVPIAVASIPEPTPPAPLESPAEPVRMPDVDPIPEPVPATPRLSPPVMLPRQVEAPPKQVETRPKPAPVTPPQRAKQPPAHARAPRPAPVAPVQREASSSPPPGFSNEPLGRAGSSSAGPAPAVPVQEAPQRAVPAEATGVGQLFAHGDIPVASGSGGSGEGTGSGRAQAGTGAGSGGGTGSGRGGGTGSGTGSGSGTSASPVGGYQVKPRYPESARRRGIEGTALLKMRITAQGSVADVQLERSAGHPELDESAMEAVRRWRFNPARRDGEPVAVWVLIPVEFKLQ
ncbi:MAG TPA: energy transducer TonB [Candidatus Tectomicrobia bacterium]